MKTITVYSASELKEHDSDAFEKAHEEYKESCYETGLNWGGEIIDSLKAVFEHSSINLKDYSIDSNGHSWVKFDIESDNWGEDSSDWAQDMTGARAQAWLENNLFYNLRETRPFSKRVKYYSNKAYNFTNYGQMESCPFTGVCFDEDFLESLQKDIKAGESLYDAYSNLARVASKLFAGEWEAQLSEESFVDHADCNEWQYTEDGTRV